MATELIELLRPHVRRDLASDVHVDVVEAMTTTYGMLIIAENVYKTVEVIGVSRGCVPTFCAGIDFGGALIAAAVAADGDFPARYLRPHRLSSAAPTPMDIIGYVAGKQIVVVDDVADVRDLMGAVSALREAGAIVEDAIVVVDREEGADALLEAAGVRLRALVTLRELTG